MKLLDIKAAQSDDAGERLVGDFFARLAAEDGPGAGRLVPDGFLWFGRPVGAAEWKKPSFAAYLRTEPMQHENVRALPPDLLPHLDGDPEEIFAGPMSEDDRVYLVDVQRSARVVTCAAVVRGGPQPTLRRVFEPDALAAALSRFGASSPPDGGQGA